MTLAFRIAYSESVNQRRSIYYIIMKYAVSMVTIPRQVHMGKTGAIRTHRGSPIP